MNIHQIINLKSHATGKKMRVSMYVKYATERDVNAYNGIGLNQFPANFSPWHGGKKHSKYPMFDFRYSSVCSQKENDKYLSGKNYRQTN